MRLSCSSNNGYQKLAAGGKRSAEESPNDRKRQASAIRLQEYADRAAADCKKIRGYEDKYGDTIDIPAP